MGEVYFRMNDYKKSIEMYKKALKIKHDFGSSHFGIAANLIKMGEYRKARDHINLWSKISSSYNGALILHYYLAISYIAEDDPENTLKEMEIRHHLAEQKADTFWLALNQFQTSEILFENGIINKAEEKLASGKELIAGLDLSERYKDFLILTYLSHSARLAVIKGNIDQAKEYAEMYKNHGEEYEDPGYIENNFTLSGLIAYAEKNYEMAISDLKQSDLNDPFNKYHIALAYIKNGDETNAIDKLESAVNYSANVSLINEKVRDRAAKQLALLKADD
jgi:tetratricopeptide (TPR) repeat protein